MARGNESAPVKTKEFDDQGDITKFLDAPQLSTRCSSFFNSDSIINDGRISTFNGLEHLGTDRDVSLMGFTSRTEKGDLALAI